MTCGFPTTPERIVVDGVALDTDPSTVASGVTFCFTERTGGVSTGPFSSLNLGFKGGDDPDRVRENRGQQSKLDLGADSKRPSFLNNAPSGSVGSRPSSAPQSGASDFDIPDFLKRSKF